MNPSLALSCNPKISPGPLESFVDIDLKPHQTKSKVYNWHPSTIYFNSLSKISVHLLAQTLYLHFCSIHSICLHSSFISTLKILLQQPIIHQNPIINHKVVAADNQARKPLTKEFQKAVWQAAQLSFQIWWQILIVMFLFVSNYFTLLRMARSKSCTKLPSYLRYFESCSITKLLNF